MQRRHWPFGHRRTTAGAQRLVPAAIAPRVRPVGPIRAQEDEAEHQLMILVGVATVAITAASAAVTYLLI